MKSFLSVLFLAVVALPGFTQVVVSGNTTTQDGTTVTSIAAGVAATTQADDNFDQPFSFATVTLSLLDQYGKVTVTQIDCTVVVPLGPPLLPPFVTYTIPSGTTTPVDGTSWVTINTWFGLPGLEYEVVRTTVQTAF